MSSNVGQKSQSRRHVLCREQEVSVHRHINKSEFNTTYSCMNIYSVSFRYDTMFVFVVEPKSQRQAARVSYLSRRDVCMSDISMNVLNLR